jgi:hypothetical protein
MVSLRNRWLFVHVPRTGGNSIQKLLSAHSDDALITDDRRDGIDRFEIAGPHTPRKHATITDYRKLLGQESFAQLFKFAVVRSPWERAISAYFAPIRWITLGRDPEWSVDDFSIHVRQLESMTSFLVVQDRIGVDTIIRYERFGEDVPRVLHQIGVTDTLPHINRGAAREPWIEYYRRDPELVELVADVFCDDVRHFAYERPALGRG